MGKQRPSYERPGCSDSSAPICGSKCCANEYVDGKSIKTTTVSDGLGLDRLLLHRCDGEEDIHELIVVGAGPHGHALILRLLEPDADFLSDKVSRRLIYFCILAIECK